MTANPPPRYARHCDKCVYLGQEGTCDLYACATRDATILVRYGNSASSYYSAPLGVILDRLDKKDAPLLASSMAVLCEAATRFLATPEGLAARRRVRTASLLFELGVLLHDLDLASYSDGITADSYGHGPGGLVGYERALFRDGAQRVLQGLAFNGVVADKGFCVSDCKERVLVALKRLEDGT